MKSKYIEINKKARVKVKYESFNNWFELQLQVKHWFWGFIDCVYYKMYVSESVHRDREHHFSLSSGNGGITYPKDKLDFKKVAFSLYEKRLKDIKERQEQKQLINKL